MNLIAKSIVGTLLLLSASTAFGNDFTDEIAASQLNGNGKKSLISKIQWLTDYQLAVAQAKSANKPIFLFFTGSDYCSWCKKLEAEVFTNPDFVQMAGNKFIFVELDFPMNKQLPQNIASQNQRLKEKYKISGFPTIVILDPSEGFIGETGYRPGGGKAFAEHLKQLLQSK